jgi:hypothetical protein
MPVAMGIDVEQGHATTDLVTGIASVTQFLSTVIGEGAAEISCPQAAGVYEQSRVNLVATLSLLAIELPRERHAFLHAVVGVLAEVARDGREDAAAAMIVEPRAYSL